MRIKSKDIAKALGLSEATVSLALNNRPGVNEETKKRIHVYMESMEDNHRNQLQLEVSGSRGKILLLYYIKHGIIMRRKEVVSPSLFFEDIKEIVTSAGYEFLYEEFAERKTDLEKTLLRYKKEEIKGIYIMAAEMNRGDIIPFLQLQIPIVTGDNLFYDLGMDSFLIDNKEGIRRGVGYLMEKGHSHIIYLAENTDIFNFKERREAFVEEMEKRQCGDSHKRILHLGNGVEEVYDSMRLHLDEGLSKVSAFVLESSVISLGVSKALLERNIRVPRDISLIGFDALPGLSIPGLNLTLIKGTHTKRHKAAIRHLIQHLYEEQMEDEMVRVYYRTRLIEGDSVFDKTKYIYH